MIAGNAWEGKIIFNNGIPAWKYGKPRIWF
jgi:hypothetical protein